MFSSKDIFLGRGAAATGYQISRSVRLRSSASAYFNRTPASASNQKTWTWSCWVKRGNISAMQTIFGAFDSATSNFVDFGLFTPGSSLPAFWCRRYNNGAGTNTWVMESTSLYRDLSAWYHVVFHLNCTSSPTFRAWINGVELTAWTQNSPPTNSNWEVNGANAHYIGRNPSSGSQYFDGYLTEINFIDGQALTPSSFGATSTTTGVWGPAKYTGTYGTNGFYLNFSDNSSNTATTIGKDSSGNGNNWTPNNISVTAGVTYDSMVDTPTPYGSGNAGGDVRGNYCVLNPLSTASTLTNGNLYFNSGGAGRTAMSTFYASSGKWYAEFIPVSLDSAGNTQIGVSPITETRDGYASSWMYLASSGNKVGPGSGFPGSAYGASYTTNDVIGVALDMDAGNVVFYKNNVSQGTMASGFTGLWTFSTRGDGTCSHVANFGQKPFVYTAPTGFKAFTAQNLSTPTIANGASYMDILLYAGDSSTSKNVTGLSFQPDFSWFKNRSSASYGNELYNAVMGAGAANALGSNNTNAAGGGSETVYGYMSAFLSNGVTVNKGSTNAGYVNDSGNNYVAWNWKANGAGSSNTSGSITSTVSAGATQGFSVVTYTGNGTAGATVGHGLGVTPSMVIAKRRDSTSNWWVYLQPLQAITSGAWLYLNLTSGTQTTASASNAPFYQVAPSSSVFTIAGDGINVSTATYAAYCWAPITGYSAFGSYTGNGSTDGPFIYTGFRPRWLMIKRTDAVSNWSLRDTSRDTYNTTTAGLMANLSDAESTQAAIDILSNGFKCRESSSGATNLSGGTYIYAAFAENPFKYSLAR